MTARGTLAGTPAPAPLAAELDPQVVVVGAGPVGLMLACELRLGGADVVVVERLTAPITESRASTLHARTMEIFDERGLLEHVGTPPNETMGHFGGIPLDLGTQDTRFPGQWKVPQSRVEQILGQRAVELGARVHRGLELVGLTADGERVRVELAGRSGPARLGAAYVVGCDGEESAVRRLAGVPFPGTDATQQLLRADVAGIDVPARRFERHPNGLAIAARLPGGVTRLMVAEFGRPHRPSRCAPTFTQLCAAWRRVTGEDISGGTPVWLNAFGNASRQAEQYRVGRVLLAGDAAHQQMPSGGQAINLGLQDAVNLGWKLAAEVRGRAPATLLDTYHTERHAVGRRVLGNIEAQSVLLLGTAEVALARELLVQLVAEPTVRDLLAGTISGLNVRYDRGAHPLLGARMPHTAVDEAGSTTQLLRAGRGVLLDLSGDPQRRAVIREVVAGWADRVVVATAAATGPCAGLDAVLVRPDGYVAWLSQEYGDPRPALRRWFGRGGRLREPATA